MDTITSMPLPRRRHQVDLDYKALGHSVDSDTLADLPQQYASARRVDRRQLIAAAVEQIIDMGAIAEESPIHRMKLESLGKRFQTIVLEGTLQQQFVCKLATGIAVHSAAMAGVIVETIVEPLTDALITVLTVGAPRTRDAAVEGLGGLLKKQNPTERFPQPERLAVTQEPNEDEKSFAKRKEVSDDYYERLERRHLMVLAIAKDPRSCAEFAHRLSKPITQTIDELLESDPPCWDSIEDALYAYPDLLRVLPAVVRQQSEVALNSRVVLCDAARLLTIDDTAPDAVVIAFARFQESVFRTLDTAMRRDWDLHELDDVLADAVNSISHTIAGTPGVCNAQVRATVAIVRTAIRLITITPGAILTKAALKPLFLGLRDDRPWTNVGILEGCYRALPELLRHSRHDDLTEPALESLFEQLSISHQFVDLAVVHRHAVANSCFRRILAAVMDTASERACDVETTVRRLLQDPTPENVFKSCREDIPPDEAFTEGTPVDIAQAIIASVAFDSALLGRSEMLFANWKSEPTLRKVLLTRILAAELHALSRDTPELDRHPLLRRIFTGIETVSLADDKAMKIAWALLSSLPSDAAETADAEIQRFVEYRGKSSDEKVNDLPGYVLAMISTTASGRIAGAIAREIDLRLRYDREHHRTGGVDFAKLLYQVTLRGPHESIFDHLLPRIRRNGDRATVLLFRKHVARVLASRKDDHDSDFDLSNILAHVRELRGNLEEHLKSFDSRTLRELHDVLQHFINLTGDSEAVWTCLATEEPLALIEGLDKLAKDETHRKALVVFSRRLADLQDDIIHYLALPIGSFDERKETLTKASDIAAELEESIRTHEGLQPPERTLLIALMRRLRSLFDDTRRWSCDEARKLKERNDKDRFWWFFCDRGSKDDRIRALSRLEGTAMITSLYMDAKNERLSHQVNSAPPPFKSERAKFEEYFVSWMTSELDVESLKKALRCRWPFFFRWIYNVTTRFWLASLTILAPFVAAAWLDWQGWHEWEGMGFFLITCAMILAALLSFTEWIHKIARKLRKEKNDLPGYWFLCLLPRLARLTAVPMALIVEFDHSYEFPLHASTWSLLLLAILSYFTTRFFVTREMVDRNDQPGVIEVTAEEHKHVRQIVAVALAHSFGIAILLSAIFASSHIPQMRPEDPSVHTSIGTPARFWMVIEKILTRFDETSEEHKEPRFLGLVPREVKLEFGKIAEHAHYPLPPKVAEHATFKFYPTIILAWTALGLFFGVFLEGFMKGERLRGGLAHEATVDGSSAADPTI